MREVIIEWLVKILVLNCLVLIIYLCSTFLTEGSWTIEEVVFLLFCIFVIWFVQQG